MNQERNAYPETEKETASAAEPQRKTARIAGILYLVIIVAGMFAQFFVRQTLVVPGDAGATATNIIASEGLFRAGIAADLVMIMADVAIGLAFYLLLKHVNHALALLAAFFRLGQAAMLAVNLLNLVFVLELLGGAEYLGAFEAQQLQALILPLLNAHGIGYALGLVFFGFSILILGYLLYRSAYFPGILGILLLLASLGYLADGFARVLLVNYAAYQPIFDNYVVTAAFIAELLLGLYLLIKGARAPQPDAAAALNPA